MLTINPKHSSVIHQTSIRGTDPFYILRAGSAGAAILHLPFASAFESSRIRDRRPPPPLLPFPNSIILAELRMPRVRHGTYYDQSAGPPSLNYGIWRLGV